MEDREQMQVSGMTCAHCVRAVTEAASRVPDLSDPVVDLQAGILSWRGSADRSAVRAAVEQEGYNVEGK